MSEHSAEVIDITRLVRMVEHQMSAQKATQIIWGIAGLAVLPTLGGRSLIVFYIVLVVLSLLMSRGNRHASVLLIVTTLILIISALIVLAKFAFLWDYPASFSETDIRSSKNIHRIFFYGFLVIGLSVSYFLFRGWRATIIRANLLPSRSMKASVTINLWISVLRRFIRNGKAWMLMASCIALLALIDLRAILIPIDLLYYNKLHLSNNQDFTVSIRILEYFGYSSLMTLLIMAVVMLVLLGLLVTVWNILRQSIAETTKQAQQRDTRAPVLLLRSFDDDSLTVLPADGRIPLSLKAHTLEATFEKELRAVGPVIAIGQPDEPLPRLGAAREYLVGESWRSRVQELIEEAQFVVVIMGASEGLSFEYNLLHKHNALNKLLLIIPPDKDEKELQQRWNRFVRNALKSDRITTPDLSATIAAFFCEKCLPTYVVHYPRQASANQYSLALQMALHLKVNSP